MNLTMRAAVLKRLTERGRMAGRRLVRRFGSRAGDGTPLTWDNHRWVRYRSSMAALERLLHAIRRGYEDVERPGDPTYEQLITRGPHDPPAGYRWGRRDQEEFALEATEKLVELDRWAEQTSETFVEGTPEPAPEARIVPRG